MNLFDILILVFFIGVAVWLCACIVKMRKVVTVYATFTNFTRIAFCLAAAFCLATLPFTPTLLDSLRTIGVSLVSFLFVWMNDGIGQESFFVAGSQIDFIDVMRYDYNEKKGKFVVRIESRSESQNGTPYVHTITFAMKNKQKVIEMMSKGMPKTKHRPIEGK